MAKDAAALKSQSRGGATAPAVEAERPPPHERLIEVAREMFCRDGIHATGIDSILAEAGVSKMTLYSRFGSKEGLVREVLLREGDAWRQDFFSAIEAQAVGTGGRLSGAVDAIGTWFKSGRFYGCAFMNAVAEHAKGEPWLRELAARHHAIVLERLEAYANEAGAAEPAMLARQVLLLIDGVIAALMVSGNAAVLDVAERNLAAILARS